MSPASAAALARVKAFWMALPPLSPRRLTPVSKHRRAMARSWAEDTSSGPRVKRTFVSPNQGRSTAVYLAKATQTAAMVPVCMTRNKVQP